MPQPLTKTFHYNAPPARVWEALTDPAQMRRWYFPQLQAFEPVVGFRFRFDDAGAEYRKEWILTQIVPGRIFAHSWAYLGHPGSSKVVFELTAEGDGTGLRVSRPASKASRMIRISDLSDLNGAGRPCWASTCEAW